MPPRRSSSTKPSDSPSPPKETLASPKRTPVKTPVSTAASPVAPRLSAKVQSRLASTALPPAQLKAPSVTASNTKPKDQPKYAQPQPSYLAELFWFPFYDWFVKFYPARWTPNGITLFGIFSTVVASTLILSSMPTMLGPLGSVSQIDSLSESDLKTGDSFLQNYGFESSSFDEKVAAANFIKGLRQRELASHSATGLYGKNISIASDAIARLFAEVTGTVASRTVLGKNATTPVLGRVFDYDFRRPQLFYQALQPPFAKYEIALSLVWSRITGVVAGATGSVIGESAAIAVEGLMGLPLKGFRKAQHLLTSSLLPTLPEALSSTPGRWLLIIAGFLNLIYCVADNTDGRHARRTKQSSFVGEYLDHGLDCVTSLLSTYLLGSALGLEASQAAIALFAISFATVLSHVVNQEKGFLIWGNRAFTVDEAMLAFGFGMIAIGICPQWIPTMVPVDAMVALGVPEQFLPAALRHVRVGEFLWYGFLVAQFSVVITLLKIDRTVVLRPSSLALVGNIVAIWYFTTTHGQPTTLRTDFLRNAIGAEYGQSSTLVAQSLALFPQFVMSGLQLVDTALNIVFSFEAQWVILTACTSSVIIHAPIAAKCYKITEGTDNRPILYTVPLALVTFFTVSSGLGSAIAVVGHVIQILWNVNKLQIRGEKQHK
eukprot:GILI01018982.1.p1 GENE.GILI01018982.1~~GILI01018982.1.p1  ORF type:complete len:660 (+),score=105.81 GILI01018982.1:60-2039(+)